MLAVVKKPHTDIPMFEVKGEIPSQVLTYLRNAFGQNIEVTSEENESVNMTETSWYRSLSASVTPGETVKIYRENKGMTQTELGRRLGTFSRHKISDIEHNKRSISKDVAKRLSEIFDVPVQRFL